MIGRFILAFGAVVFAAAMARPSLAEPAALSAQEEAVAPKPVDEPAAPPAEASQEKPGAANSAFPGEREDRAAIKPAEEPQRQDEAAAPAAAAEAIPAEKPAEEKAIAPEPKDLAASEPAGTVPAPETVQIPEPAEEPVAAEAPSAPQDAPKPAHEQPLKRLDIPAAPTAETEALRNAASNLPAGNSDEERNERAAVQAFYESRFFAPLWLAPREGLTDKGTLVIAEIKRAGEWGLDPRDFVLPAALGADAVAAPEALAAAETKISLAVLKYGRYARGGRIINPSAQLSSYLDRRPQLLNPKSILDGIAASGQPDAYLRGLNPQHPQFEKLRQKYLAVLGHNKPQSAEAKKLLANMEEWRWMPADMGELYIWNNIPEYTQRVMKNGEVIRKERIVAGKVDKQTPIFTRPLRKVTFKPTWIVPDSIKVHELWPNLMRGGSYMREWGLEIRKNGELVNWRRIDWGMADIRTFDVTQPNGPKSVMGKVKFSFPSQHTVFMHDALERDKWMFNVSRRTYSHGCMRVANPMGLAEIVLREDKGWDAKRVRQEVSGPQNNEIPLDRKVPVHITYFTALVDDSGKLQTLPDVYGHERRITLALEGKWNQIVKGRDHLAPVELTDAGPRRYAEEEAGDLPAWRRSDPYGERWSSRGSFLDSLFGGRSQSSQPQPQMRARMLPYDMR